MGSSVQPNAKEDQRWPASAYEGLGPPGAIRGWLGLLNRVIKFPINSEAKAVLGYDLGGSRLCQGYCQGI